MRWDIFRWWEHGTPIHKGPRPVYHPPEPRPAPHPVFRWWEHGTPIHKGPRPVYHLEPDKVIHTGWNIEGIANDIRKALALGYHATEQGLYDLARASGTAGYEVGTALRTGHFIPLSEAYRESGQVRENVPFLGNISGKQFAEQGAKLATQAIPIVGTFGHLASHPNEIAFQKASDVIFGIADVLPFGGELASVSRVGESSLSAVADSLRNSLAKTVGSDLAGVQNDVVKRIEHFISPISKDIKIVLPLQKIPKDLHGVINNVAKTVGNDLRPIGLALDNGPVHIIASDANGLLHNFAIAKDGILQHFVEDVTQGAKKVGESILGGGQDIFKTIRNGVEHLIHPPYLGKIVAGLSGLGIGLSVLGGLTSSSSSTGQASGTSGGQTSGTSTTGTSTGTQCDPTCGGNPALPPCPQCQAMNAGSVLQSQLQALSSSGPQTAAPVPSYASTPSSTPSSTSRSIFSNPILLIGIAIVVIVIILIAVMR